MRAPETSSVRVSTVSTSSIRAGALEVDLHALDHPGHLVAVPAVGELGVQHADEPQEVGAAALEELEIAGMIDDAGKVGVGEIDPRPEQMAGRRDACR